MREILVKGSYCRAYPIINEEYDITINSLGLMVDAIQRKLKRKKVNLVCTGTSGLYIATLMRALEPKVFTIVYLRKEGVSSHGGNVIRIKNRAGTYMLVDDFIASGRTYENCNAFLYLETGKTLTHIMMLGGGGDDKLRQEMSNRGIKLYFKGN